MLLVVSEINSSSMVHVEHNVTQELYRFRPPEGVKPYALCAAEIVLLEFHVIMMCD